MADVATAPVVLESLPICNQCHRAPVSSLGYSTCLPCRQKRAQQQKRTKERKLQLQMSLFRASTVANLPPAQAVDNAKALGKSLKRKAEAESSADVMERMRKRFKKMELPIKDDVPAPAAVADLADSERVFEKFVNAAELMKDIKRRYPDNSTSLRYYATYAIVADPEINNKARTRIVARDLRDNTPLHFNLDDKTYLQTGDAARAYAIFYKCTCRASVPATKRGDLSSFFGVKKVDTSEETPKSECRGRIEISAEDDKSHRLGWPGQRVKVTITHPMKA